MNRTVPIAAAWAVLTWNVVGVVAFGLHVDAGVSGVVAGLAVAAGIVLTRNIRARAIQPPKAPRTRAAA